MMAINRADMHVPAVRSIVDILEVREAGQCWKRGIISLVHRLLRYFLVGLELKSFTRTMQISKYVT
jgi:hypothetical protein